MVICRFPSGHRAKRTANRPSPSQRSKTRLGVTAKQLTAKSKPNGAPWKVGLCGGYTYPGCNWICISVLLSISISYLYDINIIYIYTCVWCVMHFHVIDMYLYGSLRSNCGSVLWSNSHKNCKEHQWTKPRQNQTTGWNTENLMRRWTVPPWSSEESEAFTEDTEALPVTWLTLTSNLHQAYINVTSILHLSYYHIYHHRLRFKMNFVCKSFLRLKFVSYALHIIALLVCLGPICSNGLTVGVTWTCKRQQLSAGDLLGTLGLIVTVTVTSSCGATPLASGITWAAPKDAFSTKPVQRGWCETESAIIINDLHTSLAFVFQSF